MQSVNRYLEELYGLNEAVNTKEDVQEFKNKLKKEIVKKFKGLIDPREKESLNFDLESALYWFANDFHSGQSDIWYSVLSTSDYKPGRSEKGLDDEENPQAKMFYDYLEDKYGDKKVNKSSETFGDKEYINHEFSKIKLSKDYKPQLKIMGEKSETRWISITKEQFEKIKKILEK